MGERMQGVLRPWGVVLGVAAVVVLAVLPSAAAKSAEPNRGAARVADLTTVPAIKKYLRSVGIDTEGLVVQRGARNYAGPNCPGPKWNCTQSTKVVQVSSLRADDDDDGDNRFVCRRNRGGGTQTEDKTPPDQSCVIVQGTGSRNEATCEIETTSTAPLVSQQCLITQGGNSNTAVAKLVATLRGNAVSQDVRQRIEIKQTGGSSGNNLTATQTARVNAGSGGDDDDDDGDDLRRGSTAAAANVSRSQDFHQVVCANQVSSGNGANVARVTQDGRATATFQNVDDVVIDQNTDEVASTCTGPAAPFASLTFGHTDSTNCPIASDSFGTPKVSANTCARVQQDAASGRNTIIQDQTSRLHADVERAGDVVISQGSLTGGIDSTQDQESSGISRIEDEQSADQNATVSRIDGWEITQLEDPRCCAGGHQLGNPGNTWSLEQDLRQRARVDGKLIDPEDVEGGTAVQRGANYGNCTTSGSCSVEQELSNNTETETNSCTGSSCDVFIDCTATDESGFCATDEDVEVSNTASASSDTPDPNPANNSDTETTLVVGDAPVSSTRAARFGGSAAATIDTDIGADDLADAIATEEGVVMAAAFDELPPTGTPHAVADSDTALGDFPTAGTTYAIMTTGNAGFADDENTSESTGESLGGLSVRGNPPENGTDRDVTVLAIDLLVPDGRNCLTLDFRFLSDEYQEFVNSQYNDAFIAELGSSTWSTNGSTITAPENFAFDPEGEVISVNAAGVTSMTAANAEGTTYDGATPLLSASTEIAPGEHTLYLSIFDQGDQGYDSAVFVDNVVLGTTGPGGCEEGAEPAETADLSVSIEDSPDPVEAGETLTYEITVSNAGPDPAEAVTLLDELPESVTFDSATPSQGTCTEEALTVSCELDDIGSGGSATVTIEVTP